MTTQPAAVREWTYAEYARLPDDGKRREIIAGALYVTPAPRPVHQEVEHNLVLSLGPFVRAHRLGKLYPGPIDVLFTEGDYLAPDLAFVREDRKAIVTDRGIEGPPDLVVEIVSPSTALRDRTLKRERYARYGVPEYWIVDADRRQVEVHRPADAADRPSIVTDRLVWRPVDDGPALELDVAQLFADLD